ncbi:MAG: aspartate-semialdehyde dehydrogenase [Terriglobales bacterium]|jgi:aspartate-semialdehyde dehydrogenase
MPNSKIAVGVLGATGTVGQRFVQLLEAHPWFEVTWVAASERSEGRTYAEAARWRMRTPIPAAVSNLKMADATIISGAPKVIFAALDATIAADLEPRYAEAGCVVVSNSSALRMNDDVPLVVPEVNPDHLQMIERQIWRKHGGMVVTNPNCSAIGLVMALAPLHQRFGLEKVMAVTMQAISGAGYPGVAALDILGNVIPYVAKEEEKMEAETRKLLGFFDGTHIVPAAFAMSTQCNRVPVEDGHMESCSVKLARPATSEDILAAWGDFHPLPQQLKLPSAPVQPIIYDSACDRPQPRLDVERGGGMSVSVGRLRPCGVLDWKFTVLSHNTIRGAAGAALLNAELMKKQGRVPSN